MSEVDCHSYSHGRGRLGYRQRRPESDHIASWSIGSDQLFRVSSGDNPAFDLPGDGFRAGHRVLRGLGFGLAGSIEIRFGSCQHIAGDQRCDGHTARNFLGVARRSADLCNARRDHVFSEIEASIWIRLSRYRRCPLLAEPHFGHSPPAHGVDTFCKADHDAKLLIFASRMTGMGRKAEGPLSRGNLGKVDEHKPRASHLLARLNPREKSLRGRAKIGAVSTAKPRERRYLQPGLPRPFNHSESV